MPSSVPLEAPVPRPSARVVRRVGLGFLLGTLGGWVAGLLRVRPVPGEAGR